MSGIAGLPINPTEQKVIGLLLAQRQGYIDFGRMEPPTSPMKAVIVVSFAGIALIPFQSAK